VLLGQVYGELPFMILPLFASLEKLDRLAARGRGRPGRLARALVLARHAASRASRHRGRLRARLRAVARRVPRTRPLGGARTVYAGSLIQSQFAVARDMPFGAALSFVLSLIVLALLFAFRRPLRPRRTHERSPPRGPGPVPRSLDDARLPSSCTRRSWCSSSSRSTAAG
jgi:spermidine/putrescine transport system permease protein